jgi:ATP-dependent Clp protease ATP-binding subunit ClpC
VFENYTEKARRAIFFARYEVSQLGASTIETEHLLLGLLREDKNLVSLFTAARSSADEIRKQIEERVERGATLSTAVEVPLSDDLKKALQYAADESRRLGHKHIGTEHLLIGLLRKKNSLAQEILQANGVNLPDVRRYLKARSVK